MTKIPNFENSRWRTAALLKMVLLLYLSQESSDFNEIWCTDADFDSKNGHTWQRLCNFKMADARHMEIHFLAISQQFIDQLTRNLVWRSRIAGHTQVTWPKYQISKIQDGGRPPFWKWFYRYISAWNQPLSMKFGADADFCSKDGHVTKYKNFANSKWWTAAILKIVFWLYLNDLLSD